MAQNQLSTFFQKTPYFLNQPSIKQYFVRGNNQTFKSTPCGALNQSS